jgi:hypothetical protein
MNFLDELLLEVEKNEEKRKVELNRLRADQLLTAISKLEDQANGINELADSEVNLIEGYRKTELSKLHKKISWLGWNLEQFIRSSKEKTINLPHGSLKLRLGRDKVSVHELKQFLDSTTNQKFLKVIPESYEPDIQAIHEYIKKTGHIPDGVDMKPAEAKFSFTIIRSNNNGKNEQQRTEQSGLTAEPANEVETVEGQAV